MCGTHLIGTACVCLRVCACMCVWQLSVQHGVCVISALAHNLRHVQSKAAICLALCVSMCVLEYASVCVCGCVHSRSQSRERQSQSQCVARAKQPQVNRTLINPLQGIQTRPEGLNQQTIGAPSGWRWAWLLQLLVSYCFSLSLSVSLCGIAKAFKVANSVGFLSKTN